MSRWFWSVVLTGGVALFLLLLLDARSEQQEDARNARLASEAGWGVVEAIEPFVDLMDSEVQALKEEAQQ